jgi:hypothetical protein
MKYMILLNICLVTACSTHPPLDTTPTPTTYTVTTIKKNIMDNGDHYPTYKSRSDFEHE